MVCGRGGQRPFSKESSYSPVIVVDIGRGVVFRRTLQLACLGSKSPRKALPGACHIKSPGWCGKGGFRGANSVDAVLPAASPDKRVSRKFPIDTHRPRLCR